MTTREKCLINKQAAEARMHATPEWQEAERLIAKMDELYEAGERVEARKLHQKIVKLERAAKAALREK